MSFFMKKMANKACLKGGRSITYKFIPFNEHPCDEDSLIGKEFTFKNRTEYAKKVVALDMEYVIERERHPGISPLDGIFKVRVVGRRDRFVCLGVS